MTQAKGLGKGLAALLGEQAAVSTTLQDNISVKNEEIKISDITPWSKQPRKHFDEQELDGLSDSIRKNGVVQPIIVRKAGDKFEIIAGERRWRAASKAGLKTIPTVAMDVDDKSALEIALVENIQRQDLKPIETAESYQHLVDEYGYTQEQLAAVLGKSRPAITNTLRLLTLPDEVKLLLNEDKLSAGHARALVGSKYAINAAKRIIKQGLNVRQAEQLVKKLGANPQKNSSPAARKDPEIVKLEKALSASLGLEVKVDDKGGKGKITVAYKSHKELQSILTSLQIRKKLGT